MKIDWCDGELWGLLVPWDPDEIQYMDGKTHYYDDWSKRRTKTDVINAAVKRYAYDVKGECTWPRETNEDVLFTLHRERRDKTWRKLYRKGYRVVRLKVREDRG